MYIFLLNSFILLGTSFGAARHLTRSMVDRCLAAVMLAWGNIVITSLLLAALHQLGNPTWFFRTTLLLASMSWLLLRVSGVTLLERDIGERRPAYADYVRRTNAFFPGPPKA